jgi:hypothetical protein
MLAQKLRGFESCDAPKLNRHFVKTSGNISIKSEEIKIVFPRRAHNPILRAVPWNRLPQNLPWLDGARLNLCFK